MDSSKEFIGSEAAGSNPGNGELLAPDVAKYELDPSWSLDSRQQISEAQKLLGLEGSFRAEARSAPRSLVKSGNLVKRSSVVLIVDDSEDSRRSLVELLKISGYNDLRLAESARDAFELLCLDDPASTGAEIDVVLMEIIMPGMDGIEACRRIKAHARLRDIPVLMVTGQAHPEGLEEAFAAGATDYITKPINAVEFLARLRSALALKREMECRKAWERELVELTQKLGESNWALERLSFLDSLTGIANRRFFEMILQREWARSLRTPAPLALILIDCDFFKHYNDAYGHQRGDECLQQVARALAHGLHRPGDLLARYGGEEFVAILPETDFEGASVVAETLRTAVEALGIKHASSCVRDRVTVSLGVAASVPRRDSSPNQLVAAADAALYWAKREGRNCVRAAADRISAIHVMVKSFLVSYSHCQPPRRSFVSPVEDRLPAGDSLLASG